MRAVLTPRHDMRSMEMADMAVRRHRFIREETQVLEYLKPKEAAAAKKTESASGRRRSFGRMTEREEVIHASALLLWTRAVQP